MLLFLFFYFIFFPPYERYKITKNVNVSQIRAHIDIQYLDSVIRYSLGLHNHRASVCFKTETEVVVTRRAKKEMYLFRVSKISCPI